MGTMEPTLTKRVLSVGFFRYTQSSKEWGDKNDFFFIKAAKNLDVLKGAQAWDIRLWAFTLVRPVSVGD